LFIQVDFPPTNGSLTSPVIRVTVGLAGLRDVLFYHPLKKD